MSPKKNKIGSSGKPVVVSDTQLQLSDERLRRILGAMYEKGESDGRRSSPWKSCAPYFSIAFTLLLTLMTSDFRSILGMSSETIAKIAILLLLASLAVGIFLLLWTRNARNNHFYEKRDKAVEEALKQLKIKVDGR